MVYYSGLGITHVWQRKGTHMARQNILDVEYQEDDYGMPIAEHPDGERIKIKSGLAWQIIDAVRRLGLTQGDVAQRMGITQPKVSRLLQGHVSDLSERKLMECLNRLGYDIVINVYPSSTPVGSLTVSSPVSNAVYDQ